MREPCRMDSGFGRTDKIVECSDTSRRGDYHEDHDRQFCKCTERLQQQFCLNMHYSRSKVSCYRIELDMLNTSGTPVNQL